MENPKLKRILEKVRPKTFFEELAEYGYLMQYVNEHMKDDFDNDNNFRLKIYDILFRYSKYPDTELNIYYLQHLNNSMNQFFAKVKDA